MPELATGWLVACGPERVAACRKAALAALDQTGRLPPKDPAIGDKAGQIRKADKCVADLEARRPKAKGPPVPSCAGAAVDLYRAMSDKLMLQRALYAKGLWDAARDPSSGNGLKEIDYAEKACDEPRCGGLRLKALARLVEMNTKTGDLEEAARAAIRHQTLTQELTRPPDLAYARTREVTQACARLDAKSGPGACHALEKKLTGRWSFRDFSQDKAGEALPPEMVKEVGREYAPLIEECLTAEGKRWMPSAPAKYAVRWVVDGSGRVDQVHMDKKDDDNGPLAQCLRKQFAFWRYPRTTGELQHVEQVFTVQATVR